MRFSCRERVAQDGIKKAPISRAEGGQLQAPVGRLGVRLYSMYFNDRPHNLRTVER